MAGEPKFLLGRGEKLTKSVPFHSGFGPALPPYAWNVQRTHLHKQLSAQQEYLAHLPAAACPRDQVVSVMTLHPQYYSRSAFPEHLLDKTKLRFVGSRPVQVQPRAGRGSGDRNGTPSTAMFVAGTRSAFATLLRTTESLNEADPLAQDLMKIETIEPLTEAARLAEPIEKQAAPLEIVMHFDAQADFDWENQFLQFAESAGVQVQRDLEYQTRGLWFLAARGSRAAATKLAQFSFVRTIRPMPRMRVVDAPQTLRAARGSVSIVLPSEDAIDPDCRVAIFDGGLPSNHPFGQWAKAIEPGPHDGIGLPIDDLQAHGMAVTSALLFGHVQPGSIVRPYCTVDHYRVLGDMTADRELYSTMLYVDKVLSSSTYEFANFSIGPAEIIGNDKVTAWTAMLDDHFQQGGLLAGIAVGNDGEKPAPHNRVQVPGDCVNALAIGASTSSGPGWQPAAYSSIGPGRAPGSVKPDLVQFGGVPGSEFCFLFPGLTLASGCGTSFGTPTVMRTSAGLRAYFGREISILGIRALMVHSADTNEHPRTHVGWGMPPEELTDITVCPDGSVRVLYQGVIDPAKVIRAEIPTPGSRMAGKVTIKATFCYVCQTDPHTPGDYTRAGLDICLRPDKNKMPKPSVPGKAPNPDFPATMSFFEGVAKKRTEQQLRNDAFKWDTIRHAERRFFASSLDQPVFDIHHVARQPGVKDSPATANKLPYALVITLSADKHPMLYEEVLARYPQTLDVIRPRASLPIRIGR